MGFLFFLCFISRVCNFLFFISCYGSIFFKVYIIFSWTVFLIVFFISSLVALLMWTIGVINHKRNFTINVTLKRTLRPIINSSCFHFLRINGGKKNQKSLWSVKHQDSAKLKFNHTLGSGSSHLFCLHFYLKLFSIYYLWLNWNPCMVYFRLLA